MEIPELFGNLFDYNREMNRRLIRFVSSESPAEDIRLISHIINAQAIWNSRILNIPSPFRVWDEHPAPDLDRIDANNHAETLRILETVSPETQIHYTNSRGEKYSNSVTEILFHIINHSTHHRAQLIATMRKCGVEIQPSDFIFYQRSATRKKTDI